MRQIVKCVLTAFMFLLLLFPTVIAKAKVKEERTVIDKRMDLIESHKLGLGLATSFMVNYSFLQKFYYQYGSNHSLVNADIGLKIGYENPLRFCPEEYVSRTLIPLFVGIDLNCYRWQFNALYLGLEMAYNISVSPRYHTAVFTYSIKDKELAADYLSVAGRAGVKFRNFDIRLSFSYDLKPKYNQKYIFENPSFDFGSVRNQIYERYQVGISFSYYFAL